MFHQQLVNFYQTEILKIAAQNYFSAGLELGSQVKTITRHTLDELFADVNDQEKKHLLNLSQNHLEQLRQLADQEVFVLNGVNWLKNYLDTLSGFAQGSEIGLAECALLQMEVEPGCQTLMVQDKTTQKIYLAHMEEDPDFLVTQDQPYPFRLVEMKVADIQVNFFLFPGLCTWGAAFGTNLSTHLVQTVDDLWIKESYSLGPLWANMMAFVTLGCGQIDLVRQLITRLQSLPSASFFNGYAIHLAQAGQPPQSLSLEFAHKQILIEPAQELSDRLIRAQTNAPLSAPLKSYAQGCLPNTLESWSPSEAQSYLEMTERRKRLQAIAAQINLESDDQQIIKNWLQALADPQMDILLLNRAAGPTYVFTGLPSVWTVAHLIAVIDQSDINTYMGKLLPEPIAGKEFALNYQEDYPYLGKNLWLEANKLLNQNATNFPS